MTLLLLLAMSATPDAGPFSRKMVDRVVLKHKDDLRTCSERTGLFGAEIMLTFVVSPEGRVRDVTTETMNVTDAPDLLTCVIQALRSWSFPSPGKESATVSHYRFVLPSAVNRRE